MRTFFLLFVAIPMLAFSQKGIRFEHGASWKEIQAKAKAEKKYIFMDAFTTWCGPCRYMAANIFPQEEVGNFFNQNFINIKVQLDTTKNDDEEVKKWYSDAHNIMKSYNVNVFPTYLFFDPNGKLVHRAIGSSDASQFVTKAKEAVNPETQYYVLLERYQAGEKSPEFLRKVAYASLNSYDMPNAKKASKEYLATQKDFFTKENLMFIDRFTMSTKDEGFAFLLANEEKFDSAFGRGVTNTKITEIIKQEEVYPRLTRSGTAPDWKALTADLAKKYPKQADEVVSGSKVAYFQAMKDWNNFQVAIQDYMKNYGTKVSPGQLNEYAWTVFENCKDMTCVTNALEWSKRSFKDNNNPMFIDTYANILYKLGKKDEAIEWETKAVSLVSADKKKGYEETLDKMKKGEKTWKE